MLAVASYINELNYSNVVDLISAAKHHTSKIRNFTDLIDVHTFGFRGEALSSLCAVSDMTIITRHTSAEFGTKLEIDHFGQIKSRTICPRSQGTTVSLRNIFASLPVRRREFQKNIKNEFIAMSNILRAYGLVSSQCRIVATDQSSKGGKKTILATTVSGNIRDNIISVFGVKQANDLLEIQQPMRENESLTQEVLQGLDSSIDIKDDELDSLGLSRYRFDGFISSCAHGAGRSVRDRQYFFINSRPCEPKQLIKMVNDVYRQYNIHQHPFIVLNIIMESTELDINVTPDKRQILVNQESILHLALKKSLMKTFSRIPSKFKMQNQEVSLNASQGTLIEAFARQTQEASDEASDVDTDGGSSSSQRKNVMSDLHQLLKRKNTERDDDAENCVRKTKMKKIQDFLFKGRQSLGECNAPLSEDDSDDQDDQDDFKEPNESNLNPEHTQSSPNPKVKPVRKAESCKYEKLKETEVNTLCTESTEEEVLGICEIKPRRSNEMLKAFEYGKSRSVTTNLSNDHETDDIRKDSMFDIEADSPSAEHHGCTVTTISITTAQIEELLAHENQMKAIMKENRKCPQLQFKAKIHPAKNKVAEQELETGISKSDFDRMVE